jgi:hypothetical protein
MVLHGCAKHGVKEKMVLAYMMPQTRRMEKSIVCRASSGTGCSNDKGWSQAGHFILIQPKWKKHCPQGLFWHWMFQ